MFMGPVIDTRLMPMNINVRNNPALTSLRSFIFRCASERSDPTSANWVFSRPWAELTDPTIYPSNTIFCSIAPGAVQVMAEPLTPLRDLDIESTGCDHDTDISS
jgi:hypothetical protein